MDNFTIALAQINPTVGAVAANMDRIRSARAEAATAGVDLVVCAELVASGYPPEDLVYRRSFMELVQAAIEALAIETGDGGPAVLLGAPWREESGIARHNAAILCCDGRVDSIRYKQHLPNYGVFDEARVFVPGPASDVRPMAFRGTRLGVLVCEDMWFGDVAASLKEAGAEILIVINGSPFDLGKADQRVQHAAARVAETRLPLLYVNQVGGQDELVFDGASFVMNADGRVTLQGPSWQEAVLTSRWTRNIGTGWRCAEAPTLPSLPGEPESIYQAMMLGLRDYVNKNGFPGVILGLSGGIDSALSAAVATDALGPERVRCVMLPSPYTSRESLEDAASVAALLGLPLDTLSIEPAMAAFNTILAAPFAGRAPDTTEENIQARARGITLMALSNKFGAMVLSTGNKSEMSVGYATLYGDMCGGFSVLKDVYKTAVFAVSRWRNTQWPPGALGPRGAVMPERVITKAPTAELKPNQTDQDTLPPYAELDAILHLFIEGELGVSDVIRRGHDAATVGRVWRMLNLAEYKRRQAPPGIKITQRSFGRERRYPITNAYSGQQ
ncbi:MAG: NAD+ synthase [Alphaproteobacteria bacterium]|nr:NAD+ synthase [Alphaproteobacteria bacterium]